MPKRTAATLESSDAEVAAVKGKSTSTRFQDIFGKTADTEAEDALAEAQFDDSDDSDVNDDDDDDEGDDDGSDGSSVSLEDSEAGETDSDDELIDDADPDEDDQEGEEDDGDDDEDEDEDDDDDDDDDDEGDGSDPEAAGDTRGVRSMERLQAARKLNANIQAHPGSDSDTDSDDDDELHSRNTLGKIPLHWYDGMPHIGYDLDGQRITRPATKDELDQFLDTMDNPDHWRTVKDKNTGKEVVLTEDEVEMIQRLQTGGYANLDYNPYEDTIEWFTSVKQIHPINNRPPSKRAFVRSTWEHKRVMKFVRAIREGRIKVESKDKLGTSRQEPEHRDFYLLWNDDEAKTDAPNSVQNSQHIAAPKMRLPGHEESYNPPPEYLPTKTEIEEWNKMDKEDRPLNFVPQKFKSLRQVPAYSRFIQERFDRCLDLYLSARVKKNRMNVNPESLIPQLPRLDDLQPYPTTLALVFGPGHHTGKIRNMSIHPSGHWLATGADDGLVCVWEVSTARCLFTYKAGDIVLGVAWNPNPAIPLLAVAAGKRVLLLNANLGSKEAVDQLDELLKETAHAAANDNAASWEPATASETLAGVRVIVRLNFPVRQVTWHHKGDYFASLTPDAPTAAVLIHQLSKRKSQNPFQKSKGLVQRVLFHPTRPFLFVATQHYVRVYNLLKQELAKKLISGVKWISSMDVHPGGDNLVIGSYDRKLCWFDMDLVAMPLSRPPSSRTRYHRMALRSVAFHKRFPLLASCSDDGSTHIFHGMVYNDLLKNPLIVPVKKLTGHTTVDDLSVLDVQFHPIQPWLFSAGADGTVRMYV
ncbi:Bop1-prov protein [Capsaspora owczarzaki ATCC 30864]|uniref:Ribosome biogenesis protein BOP1 homolog n=1 Tax=Capsaspora owczarzaki (strain ATCC 30864) TaxID=595528 RepID=A0A0D2WPZ5_CAPO3|nr:Bop1-prov protein [Capsaspora owczarzaki ATCC 30864]